MKILSIIAQKPLATGSGVYLTEVMHVLARFGHKQALVAGIYDDDRPALPDGVLFEPVLFRTEALPFAIFGMSDEMPYPSTRYRDMTPEMEERFRSAFLAKIEAVVSRFQPDLLLCHHLYLLTAFVRERFPHLKIHGFCHNTDLRQMVKTDLHRPFIAEQIRKPDHVFAPQQAQADEVVSVYGVNPDNITLLGTGYNREQFYPRNLRVRDGVKRLCFVGKISEKKGVMSLIRAINKMDAAPEKLLVTLAGGAGDQEELAVIRRMAEESRYRIELPGRISQEALIDLYNKSDVFVLPSFFDSIALVVIEALACGCRAVVSDLPGLQDFLTSHVTGGDIRFVPLPSMRNADEPVPEELPAFEQALSKALYKSLFETADLPPADVSSLSWDGVVQRILSV